MKTTAVYAGCLLALLSLSACATPTDQVDGVRLYDLEGQPARLSCARDRMLIVNLWTTWCAPCKVEIRHLMELQDEFRAEGFDIVGILLDSITVQNVKAAVEALNISYPVYMGDVVTVVAKTGVASVPATMIVDSNGDIVKKLVGYHSREELRVGVLETARERAALTAQPAPANEARQ